MAHRHGRSSTGLGWPPAGARRVRSCDGDATAAAPVTTATAIPLPPPRRQRRPRAGADRRRSRTTTTTTHRRTTTTTTTATTSTTTSTDDDDDHDHDHHHRRRCRPTSNRSPPRTDTERHGTGDRARSHRDPQDRRRHADVRGHPADHPRPRPRPLAGNGDAGRGGNVVVAGHRTSHHQRVPLPRPARRRRPDRLHDSATSVSTTSSTGTEIVDPDAVWIVDPHRAPTATLFACHPPGLDRQRIVVNLVDLQSRHERLSPDAPDRRAVSVPRPVLTTPFRSDPDDVAVPPARRLARPALALGAGAGRVLPAAVGFLAARLRRCRVVRGRPRAKPTRRARFAARLPLRLRLAVHRHGVDVSS